MFTVLVLFGGCFHCSSVLAQMVKNPPATQETQVQCLAWEDPLEKGKATHSSILAWRIPWAEEPGGLQSMGSQRIRHGWVTNSFFFSTTLNNIEIFTHKYFNLRQRLLTSAHEHWGAGSLTVLSLTPSSSHSFHQAFKRPRIYLSFVLQKQINNVREWNTLQRKPVP